MSENIPKTKEIELAIAETIAFLDIFDYPPTSLELWRLLGIKAEFGVITEQLSLVCHPRENGDPVLAHGILDSRFHGNGMHKGFVNEKNGFYFLPGREELIAKRSEFFHLAEKKYCIARCASNILKFIPGIKMVAVCNNFYYKPDSDIDFFIVVQSGRMWLTRALATLALHFTKLRRHGNKIADRVCLSFYVTEDNLNLEDVTLKPDDPYFNYWLTFLEPLYGLDIYQKFWEANAWLKKHLPNVFPTVANQARIVKDSWFSIFWKGTKYWCFNRWPGEKLEKLAKKIQFAKMSKKPSGPGVIINDKILKFHENDRREFFREKLKSSIINYQSSK
jgi:hypothetical protein